MTTTPGIAGAKLSPWWTRAVITTMAIGFAVLILVTAKAYQNAPPIPARAVDASGKVIFTSADIGLGQQVFLKHGLMDNGTIWGHGGYLGPDFSAQYLHALALDLAEQIAGQRFARPYDALSAEDRAAVAAVVAAHLKQNGYDPQSGTLTLPPGGTGFFDQEVGYWKRYFADPATNGGLGAGAVSDPDELRALTAFFAWAAWASVAERPGTLHSYTNNFPYDPLAGNRPTGAAVLWSAISLIFLLVGTAIVLFAFGEFGFLGWRNATARSHARTASEGHIAALKFMGVAALLF